MPRGVGQSKTPGLAQKKQKLQERFASRKKTQGNEDRWIQVLAKKKGGKTMPERELSNRSDHHLGERGGRGNHTTPSRSITKKQKELMHYIGKRGNRGEGLKRIKKKFFSRRSL